MKIREISKKMTKRGDHFISKNGLSEFHLMAENELKLSSLHELFNLQEIADLTSKVKHSQSFNNLEFSDLPLTIARGEHCFIDLYFWRRRPTVIHNHHFVGSFMCLLGKNLDHEYKFKKTRRLTPFHDLGEIHLKCERVLLPGDSAPIPYLDKFIHQNHHQAELTVNVCFRSPQESSKCLSNYLFSGLRYGKDPALLGKVARLRRLLDLGDFDFKKIKLSYAELMQFLIESYGSASLNPRFLKFREYADKKIRKELNTDIQKLIEIHDKKFEEIENDYE